jgi:hypothetical protein
MKLRALMGLICCAALLGLAPAAGAATAPIKTTIVQDGGQSGGLGVILEGHLTSPNPKCLAGRTVKLIFSHPGGGRTVDDTDLTSAGGVWGLTGDNSNFVAIHIRVTREAFGPRSHRTVCAAARTHVI